MVYSRLSALLSALAAVTAVSAKESCGLPKGCKILAGSGLQDLLSFPQDPTYVAREDSYWAPNAALSPQCILQPRTTEQVSEAVKALAKFNLNFAVRSGGHVQWAGASDIHDGITIDLGNMTGISYDKDTTLASVQPGPRWGTIFTALEPHNVGVTGGRDADVGIGGFLTGGGNAYLTGRTGFGCDAVANFEVVLADGTIVNANKTSNSDLFRALKGGWGNFGIVTRFDLETTPHPLVWGNTQIHEGKYGHEIAKNLVKFTDENTHHRQDAHLVLRTFNTVSPEDLGMVTVVVDTYNNANPPVFDDIQSVPSTSSSPQHATLGELAEGGIDPSDDRVHWFTINFNNDVEIVKKSMDIHDELVKELEKIFPSKSDFSTQCVLQPVPAFFAEIGVEKGGNMFGMDKVKTNSILWLGTVAWEDPSYDDIAHKKLEESYNKLVSYAKSRNGLVEWTYINYADKTQNPLKSYGEDNLEFMRQVSAKYDPSSMFQKQVPGSFKVSTA